MIVRLMVLIVSMMSVTASAAAQPLPRVPRSLRPYAVSHIAEAYIHRIAVELRLSEAQEAAVAAMLEAYKQAWSKSLPNERQRFIQACEAYEAEYTARGVDFNLAELSEEVRAASDVLRAELERHDEVLFSQIEAILTDEQLIRMQRVRNWRMRFTLWSRTEGWQEAAIDLMELIRREPEPHRRHYSTQPQYITLSDEAYERLFSTMDLYESMLLEGLHRSVANRLRGLRIGREYMDRYHRLQSAGVPDPGDSQDMRQMDLEVRRAKIAPMRNLERVNRIGLDLFMNELPDEDARELQRIYLESAYPTVYPDPSSADALFETLATMEGLNDNQQEAAEAMHGMYALEHDVVSRQMADAENDQFTLVWMNWEDYERRSQLFVQIADLGFEREGISEKYCARMSAMLTLDQLADVLIRHWRNETARLDAHQANLRLQRQKPPPQIISAMLLRSIASDAERDLVLEHIRDRVESMELEPADRAAAMRIMNFDPWKVEPLRPWYNAEWIKTAEEFAERGQ